MHHGLSGIIRKTALGRCLLFYVNTGAFWIHGFFTFLLAFSISGFWNESQRDRWLLSLPIATIAAVLFTGPVHDFLWLRFRKPWLDNYLILACGFAWFWIEAAKRIHSGEEGAVRKSVSFFLVGVLVMLLTWVRRRRKEAR